MIKDLNKNSNYFKNDGDKFWKVYRYYESVSQKDNSALQELLDFTIKCKSNSKDKKSI